MEVNLNIDSFPRLLHRRFYQAFKYEVNQFIRCHWNQILNNIAFLIFRPHYTLIDRFAPLLYFNFQTVDYRLNVVVSSMKRSFVQWKMTMKSMSVDVNSLSIRCRFHYHFSLGRFCFIDFFDGQIINFYIMRYNRKSFSKYCSRITGIHSKFISKSCKQVVQFNFAKS